MAQLKGRQADKEYNRLTGNLSFPDFQVEYRLEVSAEPGGVRVSINLDKALPEKLAGRAGVAQHQILVVDPLLRYLLRGRRCSRIPIRLSAGFVARCADQTEAAVLL